MPPSTNPNKRLQVILTVVLVLVLLAIVGFYIYLGMLQARQTTVEVSAPVDTVIPVSDIAGEPGPEINTEAISTAPVEESLKILEQLDVPVREEGDTSVGTAASTPQTRKPVTDESQDARFEALEQLSEEVEM